MVRYGLGLRPVSSRKKQGAKTVPRISHRQGTGTGSDPECHTPIWHQGAICGSGTWGLTPNIRLDGAGDEVEELEQGVVVNGNGAGKVIADDAETALDTEQDAAESDRGRVYT